MMYMNEVRPYQSNFFNFYLWAHIWIKLLFIFLLWLLSPGKTRTRTPAFWDTPCHPMITHTSDSHQIPSQQKTKSKLWIWKKLPKFQILKFCKKRYTRHILKLLDKMYEYEMDPTRTLGATEWTRDVGRMRDGWTDGRSETNIPPQ